MFFSGELNKINNTFSLIKKIKTRINYFLGKNDKFRVMLI
jgi:hypothetical protein